MPLDRGSDTQRVMATRVGAGMHDDDDDDDGLGG